MPYMLLIAVRLQMVTDYAVYSEMEVNGVAPQTTLADSTWQPRQLNNTDASAGTLLEETATILHYNRARIIFQLRHNGE